MPVPAHHTTGPEVDQAALDAANYPAAGGSEFGSPTGQPTGGQSNVRWYNEITHVYVFSDTKPTGTGWVLAPQGYSPYTTQQGQATNYWDYTTQQMGLGGLSWSQNLYNLMDDSMATLADHYGMPRDIWRNVLDMNWASFMGYLDQSIWRLPNQVAQGLGVPGETNNVMGSGLNHFQWSTQTPEGFNTLYRLAQAYFGQFDDRIRQGFLSGFGSSGGPGGGGGISAANFDMEYLTQEAQNIWRGLLLEENPDIRLIAQAYVDQQVAHPDTAYDFTAFVRRKALDTARARSIYRNKPEGLSEENFLMQYYQAAMQISGPHNAEAMAIGGAQMQADPYSYQARLARTAEYQSSSNFINGLEERLRRLSEVLGG